MSRALALAAALLALLVTARPASAQEARHDRLHARSTPWVELRVNDGPTPRVAVTLTQVTGLCVDPDTRSTVSYPATGSPAWCPEPRPDVVVHLLDLDRGREVLPPLHTTTRGDAGSATWSVAPGRYAFMIHGGPDARGVVTGRLSATVRSNAGASLGGAAAPFEFGDDVMADLNGLSDAASIHSVLVTDGPAYDDAGRATSRGNATNDLLGVTATEMWLLDASLALVDGDLAQSGVGAAALVRRLGDRRPAGLRPRWALVRPWTPPPTAGACLRLRDTTCLTVRNLAEGEPILAGRLRVLINDGADTDGDGLSDALENSFGLCDGLHWLVQGWSCVTAASMRESPSMAFMDPRDTDGDGIGDAAEVLGSDVALGTRPDADGACRGRAPERIDEADQTFPLWGFDPRHKDALIEIDGETPGPTCTSPAACSDPLRVLPRVNVDSPGRFHEETLGLVDWHDRYAEIPAARVNNPDRRNGIALHFDIRLGRVTTAGHGVRGKFNLYQRLLVGGAEARESCPRYSASGAMLPQVDQCPRVDLSTPLPPGTVIYAPARIGQGSACSCGVSHCLDPRHGGYGRLARMSLLGDAGQSGWGEDVNIGYDGYATNGAHELGHSLGLRHGGPSDRGGNPFGVPMETPGLQSQSKILYRSLMNYVWLGDRGQPGFSVGALTATVLPRPGPDGALSYPEYAPLGQNVSTNFIGSYGARLYRPVTCFGERCTHVDFDGDGRIGAAVMGPVEGLRRGAFESFVHGWRFVPGNACPATATVGASCGDGPTATQTMMLAGSPAATVAGGRFYGFVVDDEDPAAARCVGALCGPWQARGRLRWSAVDGIAPPAGARDACREESPDCAVNRGTDQGDVRFRNVPAPVFRGSTLLGAATLTDGSTFLTWAARDGFECATPGSPTCPARWSPATMSVARPGHIEDEGFQVMGPFAFARVDGLAVAAWNPTTGAADRALVVLRNADDDRVYRVTCTADACEPFVALADASGPVLCHTGLALTVDPTGPAAQRAAVVVCGEAPPPAAGMDRASMLPNLKFVVLRPSAAGPSVTTLLSRDQRTMGPFALPWNSAVSAAFNRLGGLAVNYQEFLARRWLVRLASRSAALAGAGGGTLDLPFIEVPEYAETAPVLASRDGTRWVARVGEPPGAVPGLAFDVRPAAVDPSLAFQRDRVRAARVGRGQQGITYFFDATADGLPNHTNRDYDDGATLAFNLCSTMESTSRGTLGPEVPAERGGGRRLQCPAGAAWTQGNPFVINGLITAGACSRLFCGASDVGTAQRIAETLTAGAWAARVAPDPVVPVDIPGLPGPTGAGCYVDHEAQAIEEARRLLAGADAGPVDAGPADAGVAVDAGPVDAGVVFDAGPMDAGPMDAGPRDVPVPTEGGSVCVRTPTPPFAAHLPVRQVDAGVTTTCAVLSDGTVWCWGSNANGGLGSDPTRGLPGPSARFPWPVTLPGAATQVSVGRDFACALIAGAVHCWGANTYGQLGRGSSPPGSEPPGPVPGLTGVVQVSAGDSHACALLSDRTVTCWGWSPDGRAGGIGIIPSPQAVAGLDDVRQISAGTYATCALRNDSTLRCFGQAVSDDIRAVMGTPVEVVLPRLIRPDQVDVGSAACVSTTDLSIARMGIHEVYCWGINPGGVLGTGSSLNPDVTPRPVAGVRDPLEVSAGESLFCARVEGGAVLCWGTSPAGFGRGEVLFGTVAPGPALLGFPAAQISVGMGRACALVADELRCWGAAPGSCEDPALTPQWVIW